jgi:hypothetical protein
LELEEERGGIWHRRQRVSIGSWRSRNWGGDVGERDAGRCWRLEERRGRTRRGEEAGGGVGERKSRGAGIGEVSRVREEGCGLRIGGSGIAGEKRGKKAGIEGGLGARNWASRREGRRRKAGRLKVWGGGRA